MPGHARQHSTKKMAESIDVPFGLWTRVGRRKHKFNSSRQVAPMCPHRRALMRAHWINLANTTEPSVFVGDASLCEITLTTCSLVINFSCIWPLTGDKL